MQAILTYILNHCLFLFERYGFKFADSSYAPSFGGDADVIVVSSNLKMRFVFDRSQLLLLFSSATTKKTTWYSIDLISQLITGNVENTAVLNEHYASFLEKYFGQILEAFSDANVEATQSSLHKLAQQRAKRLFG